jgi:hypothetical protein
LTLHRLRADLDWLLQHSSAGMEFPLLAQSRQTSVWSFSDAR